MDTPSEYLRRTESAARRLFEGIESYVAILKKAPTPVFVTSYSNDSDLDAQRNAWAMQNEKAIQASLQAERDFSAESFALATLCGSVLQVAAKAIECYSTNMSIPADWANIVKPGAKAVRFCTGRQVRRVSVGMIILAGRNQHMHFEDTSLREPSISVFKRLAIYHGKNEDPSLLDPAFDLRNSVLISFASNVTALLGWRSYAAYESDMRELLAI